VTIHTGYAHSLASSSWQIANFADVIDVYQPTTISTKQLKPEGKFRVYGANGVIGNFDEYTHEDSELLMTCRGATCGSLTLSEPFSWINGNAMVVRPKDDRLDLRYIYYALLGGVDLKSAITGTAQPQITRTSLAGLAVPYPNSEEQKRIVAKLDKALGDLDQVIENSQTSLDEIDALWTSVLSRQFKPESENSKGPTSSKWSKVSLEDTTYFFADGNWIESKDQSEEGIRLVQTGNIGQGWYKANDHRSRFISQETFDRLGCTEVQTGDVLVSRLPDPIGRACIVPDLGVRIITGVDCSIIRFGENVLPAFFVYYSQSAEYLYLVNSKAGGSTRQRISRSNLGDIEIPLPDIHIQKLIVSQLDDLKQQIDSLRKAKQGKIEEASSLRSSILSAAFAGDF
jgi:type I restriction enzyme S subunit